VSFLYQLMRDELPPGRVEQIMRDSLVSNVTYSNGWLARHAEFVAKQLTEGLDAASPSVMESPVQE